MKCRVCVLIPGFSDGGAQKQCIFLLNELQTRSDVEVTLIHFHDGVHVDLLKRDDLRIEQVAVRSNYDLRNIGKIAKILRAIQPDILMTWLQSCDVYGFFLRRSVPGMRWVMTERDSSYPRDPRFILRRYLGRYADAIIANSEMGAVYWKSAGAHGRIEVIGNIAHTNATPASPLAPRIVTVGRLEPQKNTGTVVDAFMLLADSHPNLGFAVIGSGSELEVLRARVARSKKADRIAFLGFRQDVPAQIANSSLVVSMSHHEGLPNAMIESVAGDRLVVASDIPEHRELLGPTYPHYVQKRTDPESVADAINVALAAADDTGHLTYARARLESMGADVIANEYLASFDRILATS